MSHLSKIFEEQPIRVQNVNGFDLSHINCGTALCGTLTPVLCRMLMQGTKFRLGVAMNVELPPLATSFFGRIDACVEVFFVPCSILYGGWKQFISNQVATMFPSSQDTIVSAGGYALPVWQYNETTAQHVGTLAATNIGLLDYLYFNDVDSSAMPIETVNFSLLPELAYHRVWDVFYRNPQVTKTIFAVNPNVSYGIGSGMVSPLVQKNVSLIWHSFYTSSDVSASIGTAQNVNVAQSSVFSTLAQLQFPDGASVFKMRQRNYSRDYFTAASVSPQQGSASTLSLTVDLDSGEGEFTIAALRNANSLQKFLEAANYDPTYRGIMRAHFGKTPSDADHDEPTYIGRCVIPVYQKSVYNQDGSTTGTSSSENNPFAATMGSRAAHGSFSGEGTITESFTANCFGYLMGIFSLVPHTMYNSGIDRMHTMTEIGDFPFPELQSVGMDAIHNYEIYFDGENFTDGDFAYIPRYSYWKYINDSAHGELRPGASLQSFVLQRVFSDTPEFSTDFCEIPTTALDDVLSVTTASAKLSCWYEIYWVFKAAMPLAAFCVPTLGELQDTHTIKVTQGGSRL